MKIDDKYIVNSLPFNLEVVKAFDFELEPTFLLEKDAIGNYYLSYLVDSNEVIEQRAILPVSFERLNKILKKEINLSEAFNNPENKSIYIYEIFHENGKVENSYLLPKSILNGLDLIPIDYDFEYFNEKEVSLDEKEIVIYSNTKRKIIIDFYLKSQNLINSIKPYAFNKVFIPFVDIIKSLLEIDNRQVDRFVSYSNLRQSSLGITIEIDDPNDLFIEKEINASELMMRLLNADEKEDFERITTKTKKSTYIKYYSKIINTIIENDAQLFTAYASPFDTKVYKSIIDKDKAIKVKKIIDEAFDVIEDIEIVTGIFLEIDLASKHPIFKIQNFDDESTLKGKIELSIIDKVKSDYINIGKEKYKFTIKTIYHPETSVKPEEIERFLIDYESMDNAR